MRTQQPQRPAQLSAPALSNITRRDSLTASQHQRRSRIVLAQLNTAAAIYCQPAMTPAKLHPATIATTTTHTTAAAAAAAHHSGITHYTPRAQAHSTNTPAATGSANTDTRTATTPLPSAAQRLPLSTAPTQRHTTVAQPTAHLSTTSHRSTHERHYPQRILAQRVSRLVRSADSERLSLSALPLLSPAPLVAPSGSAAVTSSRTLNVTACSPCSRCPCWQLCSVSPPTVPRRNISVAC